MNNKLKKVIMVLRFLLSYPPISEIVTHFIEREIK